MMIRPFTLFCAFFAGISGMVLYAQKHKTTQLDKGITKIVYDTQKIKSQTAMLRTEWTLLNQPDRLKKLANNFIPGLRPLNPSQFVQMASVASVLPPIQQEPKKDKTREDLVKNVAQNNGQPTPIIADIVKDKAVKNKKTVATVTQITEQQPQQSMKSATIPVTIAKNTITDPIAPPATIHRKKIKAAEIADATSSIETQNLKPQNIKKATITNNNNVASETQTVSAPTRHKKVKTTEIADATDAIETQNLKPQTFKKNHIHNVSYNIQNDNPFSHNKANHSKQVSSTPAGINNGESTLDKKFLAKQTQKTPNNTSKKQHASIKVARNDNKKSNYTESALGGNSDGALPAPVPFSH